MMILVLGDGAATAHALTAAKQLGGDEIHILDLHQTFSPSRSPR